MSIVSTYHRNFVVLFSEVFNVTHLTLFNSIDRSLHSAVTLLQSFTNSGNSIQDCRIHWYRKPETTLQHNTFSCIFICWGKSVLL